MNITIHQKELTVSYLGHFILKVSSDIQKILLTYKPF